MPISLVAIFTQSIKALYGYEFLLSCKALAEEAVVNAVRSFF